MLVFGVLVRSRTQFRLLSRCASVGALHASAALCVGGLPPSNYGIHATGTVTNTEGINDKVLASSPIQLYLEIFKYEQPRTVCVHVQRT